MEYLTRAIGIKNMVDDMLTETDWESVDISNTLAHVTLEKKQFDNFVLDHYRASVIVSLPQKNISNNVWNITEEEAQRLETNITKLTVLEEIEKSSCKIMRQVNSVPLPFDDRETVFVWFKFDEENSTYLIGFSVDHDSVLVDPKLVRTSVSLTVFKFTAINDDTTLVQRLLNADPNGYIPKFVIDSQAHKVAETLAQIHTLGSGI